MADNNDFGMQCLKDLRDAEKVLPVARSFIFIFQTTDLENANARGTELKRAMDAYVAIRGEVHESVSIMCVDREVILAAQSAL